MRKLYLRRNKIVPGVRVVGTGSGIEDWQFSETLLYESWYKLVRSTG
jgi:hypothetical protein